MDFNPSTEVNEATLERLRLDHRLNVGASWFFWIAALTFISSFITLVGKQSFGFIIGLGITQLIDNLEFSSITALSIDTLLASLFLFLGLKARKVQRWPFILGIILYGFDTLVFLWIKDYVGLIFHAFVILGLLGGLQAINQMHTFSYVPASETKHSTVH